MSEIFTLNLILFIFALFLELKPRVAVTLLPGLPAYILFMCIRHTDHVNDDEKVRSLLNNLVNGVKRVIKKRHEDLDSTVLWLSNTLRLLHTLKQYSGEKAFQTENTPKQNEQSLKNFDLSEYRQVLSDIGVWIYNVSLRNSSPSVIFRAGFVPSVWRFWCPDPGTLCFDESTFFTLLLSVSLFFYSLLKTFILIALSQHLPCDVRLQGCLYGRSQQHEFL